MKNYVCRIHVSKKPFDLILGKTSLQGTKVACSSGKTVFFVFVDELGGDRESIGTMPPVDGGVVSSLHFTFTGSLLFSWYGGLSWARAERGAGTVSLDNPSNLLCAACSPDDKWCAVTQSFC